MGENSNDVSVAELQHLILTSGTLELFLEGFAEHASTVLEGTVEVLCGVMLKRENHAATVASSSPEAIALDEVQYGHGEGPCLHAIRTGTTTVVADGRTDTRWPKYFAATKDQGYHSVLGVPLLHGDDGGVAVNLYARKPNAFTPPIIERVESYAAEISLTLQLALRLAAHERASTHLKAAMESRTNIDIAVGIVVAQNRCTPDEAIGILQRASNGQNIKLRALAEQLVTSIGTTPATTHFSN
ncbi:GAF and ANTAR domain-containing protein [Arthrobacter sp. H41]|uniref:GAF and ANTAR domain-containing protein n=1 Tax=Arthrobacter sp. H41 TaxID=1312978 RepID=UPI0004796991|nr:GAF and ANTAR domain-containing protein [Arthrobacter sp. H41]